MNPEIFREYDIRGVVGRDYDRTFAADLGRAFATYLKIKKIPTPWTVSVGIDARLSGPDLQAGLIDGLVESGVNVVRLGVVTTPLSYYSTFHSPLSGAVMITGSHNPPDYNGFKISLLNATIFGEEIQVLKKIILEKNYTRSAVAGTVRDFDIRPDYIKHFAPTFNIKNSPKVVIDCGNGAAGVVVRRLYEAIGVNAEYLFEEPDGRFPNHHPDPTVAENIVALRKRVVEVGAAAGIGFDGDADRIGVVDNTGRALYGDELMVVFSRAVLLDYPGSIVIGDVKCSDRLYDDIAAHGGKPLMYKTGHSLIKDKMKEVGSMFSGEMSGHVFFADKAYGYDDALYAGARLIEILAKTGKNVSQLLEGLPQAFSTPEIRIDTTEDKKWAVVDEMKRRFHAKKLRVNEIDGVRVSYGDGFALVRASNTQPVIVCRFEATTAARLKVIQTEVESEVRSLL